MNIEAVFSDRDGVLIENRPDYVRFLNQVQFIPNVLSATKRLADAGVPLIIVTNQSAVGRGIASKEQIEEIQEYVVEAIAKAGGQVIGSYICPCSPEQNCDCRKPKPGMFLQAAAELGVNPLQCAMVGDAVSDMQAGIAVGCDCYMVETGRGMEQKMKLTESEIAKTKFVSDFSQAVDLILESRRK